jgi:hypothetical protein
MHPTFTLAGINDEELILATIIFGGGFAVAIIAIIASAVRDVARGKQVEESRREIAAYVAEGTITPDDAAKILAGGAGIKERVLKKLGV